MLDLLGIRRGTELLGQFAKGLLFLPGGLNPLLNQFDQDTVVAHAAMLGNGVDLTVHLGWKADASTNALYGLAFCNCHLCSIYTI